MLNCPPQQVAPLGGVLRAAITTRLFANRLTAHLRASTRSRERWMFLVIDDPLAVAGRNVVAARVIRNFDDFPEELVRLLRARVRTERLAWEGHALHTSDREVRRHCCVSDPRR